MLGQLSRAVLAAVAIIFSVVCWLGLEAPKGTLTHTDELLTAERSREILLTGTGVMHYNFQRSFEKPPLQYWLTAWTLSHFENRTLAVRIWPLLFGCFTLAATGWLVFLVAPNKPWLIPLTVAILASSPLFSPEAVRGFLDMGLTFFTIMTIVFAQLARRHPVWWLATAIACWLGSLQKIPLPFLVWVLIIIVRVASPVERSRIRSLWLVTGLFLAVLAMSAWPLLQIFKYQMRPGAVFHQQVVVWTGPTGLGNRPYLAILFGLSTLGGACGLISFFAAFSVLFSKREETPPAVKEIAIVSLVIIGLAIVTNFRGVRYIVPIIPCLCFLLGIVFYRFLERGPVLRRRAVIALVLLLTADFVHSAITITRRRKDVTDEKLIAEKLGTVQRREARTLLIRAEQPGIGLWWYSFYLFYGNLRFPVEPCTVEQIERDPPKPPVVGVCVSEDLLAIRNKYPNLRVELACARFVCWQVKGD
jgi:4-amino-4-deoxy-L-arabinose transferase-like glycosyltransferase